LREILNLKTRLSRSNLRILGTVVFFSQASFFAPALAVEIPIRVEFHPLLLQSWEGPASPDDVIRAITERAEYFLGVAVCTPAKVPCAMRLDRRDHYRYTMTWQYAELEDPKEPASFDYLNGISKIFGTAPLTEPTVPRTVYLVRDIEECPQKPPDKFRVGGCTRISHSRIVLALGLQPYPSAGAWLDSIAWALAHELGHALGLCHDFAVAQSLGGNAVKLMNPIVPVATFPGQTFQPVLSQQQLSLFQSQRAQILAAPCPR